MGWVELKFERLLNFFIGVGKLVMEIETVRCGCTIWVI